MKKEELSVSELGAHDRRKPRRPWRFWRVVAMAAGALLLFFIVGFGFFADHVGRMTAPANIETADAIVVLTGGHSRLDAAVDLLKAGKGRRLLISGVNPKARADDLRAATGSDPSLFECCIDIDRAALDTIGNAEESAKWVIAHTYASVIVVTNNYHMPRSMLEMRRILPEARLFPYPVVNTPLSNGAWLSKPNALRVLATEYTKYVAALMREVVPLRRRTADMDLARAPS